MKKIDKIYVVLIVILILVLGVTFSLPDNIVYKPVPGYIIFALIFSVFIVIPCIYIYNDFKNHLLGVIASGLYFILANNIFLIMVLFSGFLHIINPLFVIGRDIETRGKCLYVFDENDSGNTYISSAYRSKYFIFYEEIGITEEC